MPDGPATTEPDALTEDERRILWEQFGSVLAESQESYDNAVRTLAAAGVAVTVSLVTAIHEIALSGIAALIAFVVSLGLNLLSFATAQVDMRRRLAHLRRKATAPSEWNRWSTTTTVL